MAGKTPARSANLATWILGLLVAVVLAALIVPGLMGSQRADNERHAFGFIKTIAYAEDDFRGNDRDRNGVQDYWTGNVSGLVDLVPPGDTAPIGLMDPKIAGADTSRPDASPCHGYWYFAMDRDETGQDYRQGPGKDRNPSKFGFGTFPDRSWVGRFNFYINEGNTIFRPLDTDDPPRRDWPTDGELRRRYTKPGG